MFTYYEKIGSPTHRNIMEIASTYRTKFQFVISSYNDSLAYLPLDHLNLDLAQLPAVKIFVLLCAEAVSAPCPLTTLPQRRDAIPQYDFKTYLDNILLQPVVEYPSEAGAAAVGTDADAAAAVVDEHSLSFFADERIHVMTLSFDSRAEKGEEARQFLRESAKRMSVDYRGLVSC